MVEWGGEEDLMGRGFTVMPGSIRRHLLQDWSLVETFQILSATWRGKNHH